MVIENMRTGKRHALRMYYGAKNIRAQFAEARNWSAVAEYELIMQHYLTRLRALRFQEVYYGWPQLLPAAASTILN